MSTVMARIAAKRFGTANDNASTDAQPSMPPFVATLLKQMGLDPAKIITDVKGYAESILETMSRIDSRLAGIEGRLSDIESNQALLMRKAFEDDAADELAAKMVAETPTI